MVPHPRYATASICLGRAINQYNPIAIPVMARNMTEERCIVVKQAAINTNSTNICAIRREKSSSTRSRDLRGAEKSCRSSHQAGGPRSAEATYLRKELYINCGERRSRKSRARCKSVFAPFLRAKRLRNYPILVEQRGRHCVYRNLRSQPSGH